LLYPFLYPFHLFWPLGSLCPRASGSFPPREV
jgi:hypothetical protein